MAFTSAGRSYNDAVEALNTLQTPFAVLQARQKAGMRPDASYLTLMRALLRRIGYNVSDLDRLNIIHVAGTKGKGTTCAFVNSILSRYQLSRGLPRKTGLFTSPHLMSVRERIRINSEPISEELFAKYFFEVWDRLGFFGIGDTSATPEWRLSYGRYLTLMSWHAFLQEGVDLAVYETGVGGEFDATNLVEKPVASGITTLEIDHVFALGNTVDKIAWHKAGIMKTGSPAFTTHQVPEAVAVLRERAKEKGVNLGELDVDTRLTGVNVRPDAMFQKRNATLAIALAEKALGRLGLKVPASSSPLPQEFVDGIERTAFRGRCETKTEDTVKWHVDGAHTRASLAMSSQWFTEETAGSKGPRVMIFNQQGRTEAIDFLNAIQVATRRDGKPSFEHVVFCTNVTHAKTGYKRDFVNRQVDPDQVAKMTVQHRFAERWSTVDPSSTVVVLPTIEEAIDYTRGVAKDLHADEKVQAYVTGSLHLVGGVLGVLEQTNAL